VVEVFEAAANKDEVFELCMDSTWVQGKKGQAGTRVKG
jgi:hypothetical protein